MRPSDKARLSTSRWIYYRTIALSFPVLVTASDMRLILASILNLNRTSGLLQIPISVAQFDSNHMLAYSMRGNICILANIQSSVLVQGMFFASVS